VEEIRASSQGELQQQLFADSWQPQLGRFRSDFAYRGRNDAAEDLRTSLDSATSANTPSARPSLALAQHHGLPTRLLLLVLSEPEPRLDEWLEPRPQLARRLVIPAELKWEVRDKLDQANITERVLFPGLDGLSRWLARYYTPREAR
jgi:hypothetical protein